MCCEIEKQVKEIFQSKDSNFPYMMLGRLKSDMEYYYGDGARSARVLYMGNVDDQLGLMQSIYDKLEHKPVWCTQDDINSFKVDE